MTFAGFSGHLDLLVFDLRGTRYVTVEGLNADGTISTDDSGEACFYVSWTGDWKSTDTSQSVTVTASGSFKSAFSFLFSRESFVNELTAAGKAILWGTESFPNGQAPGALSWILGWASEVIPFVSDIRTLGMELYKFSSGCDRVSGANIAFASVGLVVDALTFGVGGRIVNAGKLGAKALTKAGGKVVLKTSLSLAKKHALTSVIAGATSHAIETAINTITCLLDQNADNLPNDHWSIKAIDYFDKVLVPELEGLAQASQEAKERFSGLLNSVDDIIDLVEFHENGIELLQLGN
jgi:hypothetical protein